MNAIILHGLPKLHILKSSIIRRGRTVYYIFCIIDIDIKTRIHCDSKINLSEFFRDSEEIFGRKYEYTKPVTHIKQQNSIVQEQQNKK